MVMIKVGLATRLDLVFFLLVRYRFYAMFTKIKNNFLIQSPFLMYNTQNVQKKTCASKCFRQNLRYGGFPTLP
jgi:hypothetical protein